MDEKYFDRIITTVILAVLFVLSFLLLKTILLSIIMGLILGFVFYPVYKYTNSKLNSRDLSAFIICLGLIILIVIPIWFLTPVLLKQTFQIYNISQNLDLVTPLKKFFPSVFSSEQFSSEIASVISSLATKTANKLVNWVSNIFTNFASWFLQFIVVIFTFYFALKEKEELSGYIKSLLPFSKEVEK
jgi:predicted PurR-regulated permease PerM